MTENRFSVDYAKLGTSACKKCKAKIAKGEIRIAKITPSPFSEGDTMKVYHHVPCIFATFLHARATTKIIESSTDLDGWTNISPADREIILEQIKQVQTTRANRSTSKSPTKKATKSAAAKQTTITPTKKISPPTAAPISTEDDDESTVDYDDIEIIDKKTDVEEIEDVPTATTNGVHVPLNDDPKHPDNSFRQFRGLCTKIAEVNGHFAKTAIVKEFITYGTDGESYKGENI
jgi:DNA ligase-3